MSKDNPWIVLVELVGISHLLQPPLTARLARALGLREAFAGLPDLASGVAQNMALASVAIPTTLGVWLALHADQAFTPGAVQHVAVLLGLFWTWRLLRQYQLKAVWGAGRRGWWTVLTVIFICQGPGLLALLALGSRYEVHR